MTLEERIDAVARHGFTRRQARFLVTVMRHAGVCVPRQYAALAGIAYGHKTNVFFNRLVSRRYAVACGCLHNRARLFHVQHRRLYEAIGEPHSRLRRPVSAAHALERLMLLDAVIALPELEWLTTEADKVNYFTETAGVATDSLPYSTAAALPSDTARRFPDGLPIGIESSGRVMLLYLVTDLGPDGFRSFLRRHLKLLRAASNWTVRLVMPRPRAPLHEACQTVVREELEVSLEPRTIDRLRAEFQRRRETYDSSEGQPSADAFSGWPELQAGRIAALYSRWLKDGDSALEGVSSRLIADALDDGRGRVESFVIPHAYRHLSPVVNRSMAKVGGVEKGATRGATTPARPQPLAVGTVTDVALDSAPA
jgi:hypothetical protein